MEDVLTLDSTRSKRRRSPSLSSNCSEDHISSQDDCERSSLRLDKRRRSKHESMRLQGRLKGSKTPSHAVSHGSNDTNGSNGAHGTNGFNNSNVHSLVMSKSTNGHTLNPAARTDQNGSSNRPNHRSSSASSSSSPTPMPRQLPPTWHGHDREQVSRLLIQTLNDLGYRTSATCLSRESGFELETPNVSAFRSAILEGRFDDAELLMLGEVIYIGEPLDQWRTKTLALRQRVPTWNGKGLSLVHGADGLEMLFWIRQQKYLELLEKREVHKALAVLRDQLTPHAQGTERLHALGGLLMCASPSDMMDQADWDGALGSSRQLLLSSLSSTISPKVMIPEYRLSFLLHQMKSSWIDHCLYHNTRESPSLYSNHECTRDDFPDRVTKTLELHHQDVWCIEYSHNGRRLATGGMDMIVHIFDTDNDYSKLHSLKDHKSGICHIAWSPDDTKLITCSKEPDNTVRVWDAETGKVIMDLDVFGYPPTVAKWLPDGENFIVGSLDAAHAVVLYNLYDEHKLERYLSEHSKIRIYDLALAPEARKLIAMSKTKIHVLDLHSKEILGEYNIEGAELTSISASFDGNFMLVSMNPDKIQLMSIDTGEVIKVFKGHKQRKFMIRSSFGGAGGTFIVSGSEDAAIYVWRTTGQFVDVLHGHSSGAINAISWHPTTPSCFASAGDDGKVQIWSSERYAKEFLGQ